MQVLESVVRCLLYCGTIESTGDNEIIYKYKNIDIYIPIINDTLCIYRYLLDISIIIYDLYFFAQLQHAHNPPPLLSAAAPAADLGKCGAKWMGQPHYINTMACTHVYTSSSRLYALTTLLGQPFSIPRHFIKTPSIRRRRVVDCHIAATAVYYACARRPLRRLRVSRATATVVIKTHIFVLHNSGKRICIILYRHTHNMDNNAEKNE